MNDEESVMRNTKKRLGISFSTTNFHYYRNWFTKEDLKDDLELILLSFKENNIEAITSCDGFVLTGGVDIHPSYYGESESYPNAQDFQPERDAFEQKIYHYSQERGLPLLAICRGMQLVNVLTGGKLVQDLGNANPIHKKEGDTDKLHHIDVSEHSLLNEIAAATHGQINSAHHQAIHPDAIGDNLIATAQSPEDGTIEAMEFANKTGKAFMLCVQWHPERMQDAQSPFSNGIKQRFLKEIRNQK